MSKKTLESAINKLEIQDVFLATCEVSKKDEYLPSLHKEQVTIQFMNMLKGVSTADVLNNEQYKSMLIYQYAAGFRVVPTGLPEDISSDEESMKEHILAEVKATFSAMYFTKEEITEDEVDEFGASNVAFNVWPYWREYASSVSNRMRLPHFIIPFKRMKDV